MNRSRISRMSKWTVILERILVSSLLSLINPRNLNAYNRYKIVSLLLSNL